MSTMIWFSLSRVIEMKTPRNVHKGHRFCTICMKLYKLIGCEFMLLADICALFLLQLLKYLIHYFMLCLLFVLDT